jgi:L-2-hydroxycarboxylate dehydrogenase (NAD+)
MIIEVQKLKKLVEKVLITKFNKKSSDLILSVIMHGELSGVKSHGIIRLLSDKYAILKYESDSAETKTETSSSVFIDMKGGNGVLAGATALEKIMKLGRKTPIAIVGTKNSFGSSGCLTYYAEQIANAGLIGIIMAKATPSVAPFTGTEKLLGTNPIAFGFPKKNGVFVFDMATSAITRGAVVRASLTGTQIPAGVAIDENGTETVDPNEALKGAFRTFGGYKGSGLSLVVEMLAGILTGASFGDFQTEEGLGNLFITINPTKVFGDLSEFENRVDLLIESVRHSKTMDGQPVRIPGESELAARDKALKENKVEVDDELIKEIEEYLKNRTS